MAKESVLSIEEKQSISIEEFIFHIIIQEEDDPIFLDAVTISDEHKAFFRDRLVDVSQGSQYIFSDKTKSVVYELCKSIVTDTSKNFLESSKKLTTDFKRLHSKNTSNGVFITALAKINGKRELIFLVKLDHKKVYRYQIKDAKALLEEIKNTFIEDKSAIQKVALIDTSNHYLWDVLAYDRAKPGSLTDYFRNFLSVIPRETPSILTAAAITHANRWANLNKGQIDPAQEPSHYKERAMQYLATNTLFDSDEYIRFVIYDEDDKRREILKKSFQEYIIEKGLDGQSFAINKGSLNKKSRTHTRITNEGVKIEWIGDPKDSNVSIPNQKGNDGLYHIEILTSEINSI